MPRQAVRRGALPACAALAARSVDGGNLADKSPVSAHRARVACASPLFPGSRPLPFLRALDPSALATRLMASTGVLPSSRQRTPPGFRHSDTRRAGTAQMRAELDTGIQRRSSASGPSADKEKELPACKNCHLHTPAPYLHSFSTPLDQCKNQSWQTSNNGWIVTPTSSAGGMAALADSAFCSGDCLFSYLFSHDLLSSQKEDDALHFFKRVDTQRTKTRPTRGLRAGVGRRPRLLTRRRDSRPGENDNVLCALNRPANVDEFIL